MCHISSVAEIMGNISDLMTGLTFGHLDNGQLSGRRGRGKREKLSWHFQASEAPEDRVENTIVGTHCCGVLGGS